MDELQIKRTLRRKFSPVGWTLVLYMILMNITVPLTCYITAVFQFAAENPQGLVLDLEALKPYILDNLFNNAWGYLIAAFLGGIFLLIWKKGKFCFHDIWEAEKPMTVKSFFMLLAIFMTGQTFFQLLAPALEAFFNQFGITISDSIDSASAEADSFSMFLYMGLIAPVTEEIVFRGFAMQSLKPFGRRLAIIGSAFLFGIFHENIIQSPYAYAVGIVLGYTAMEYGLGWSMVLHMANNLIFGDTMTRLTGLLPGDIGEILFVLFIYACAVATIIILVRKRREVGWYFAANRVNGTCMKAFFKAPGVVVLTVITCGSVIMGLLSQLF